MEGIMDRPWKVFERQIAAIFGTTRALQKGTKEIKDIGPEDDFPLLLDCKVWKKEKWQVVKWMKKLEANAQKDGMIRWPVLCVKEPGKVRKYAITRKSALFQLITKRVKGMPSERFFHCAGGERNHTPILKQWNLMLKEIQRRKKLTGPKQVPDDVIPMLSILNTKHDMDLVILTPEDLARIFYAAGVLKKIGGDLL